jgi:hypothetical protein
MSNAVTSSQLSYSQQDLQDFVSLALAEARGLGASEAEVGVSVETGLSVTARLREVETLEYQRDRGMGVTVYRGKRKGSASTGDLSASAIRDTVAKAFSIAGFTAEDEAAGLPEPDTLAREFPISICSIPGRSIRMRRAIRRSRARRPRSMPIRASATPKARRCRLIAACACSAIRSASWAIRRPPCTA